MPIADPMKRFLRPTLSFVGMLVIANLLGLLISVLLSPGSRIFAFTALMSLLGFAMVYGPMIALVTAEYFLMHRYRGQVSDGWFFAVALMVAFGLYWVYIPVA